MRPMLLQSRQEVLTKAHRQTGLTSPLATMQQTLQMLMVIGLSLFIRHGMPSNIYSNDTWCLLGALRLHWSVSRHFFTQMRMTALAELKSLASFHGKGSF